MKNMNHLVSLLQEGYTTIGVVFSAQLPQGPSIQVEPLSSAPAWSGDNGQRVYTYKCHFECIVGDQVILPPSSAGKLPSIGTVVRVDAEPELNFESGIEYKWAVGRIDFTAHDDIMKREVKLIAMLREGERRKHRDALLQAYQLDLPSDGESRKIFDQARQIGLTTKDS